MRPIPFCSKRGICYVNKEKIGLYKNIHDLLRNICMNKNISIALISYICLQPMAICAMMNPFAREKKTTLPAQPTKQQLNEALRQTPHSDLSRAIQLVAAGAHPEYYSPESFTSRTSLIHEVATKGTTQQMQTLLQSNLSIQEKDSQGVGLLHAAARGGNLPMVQFLVEKGLSNDDKDNEGATPPLYAAQGGHINVIDWFFSQEVPKDIRDYNGEGLLHYAVVGGHDNLIRQLVNLEVSVDALDVKKRTPLHRAVELSRPAAAIALLHSGADHTLKDEEEKIPLLKLLEKMACKDSRHGL